jgi:hypothetical protein
MNLSRRKFLLGGGSSGLAFLAGCVGGNDSDSTDGAQPGDGNSNTGDGSDSSPQPYESIEHQSDPFNRTYLEIQLVDGHNVNQIALNQNGEQFSNTFFDPGETRAQLVTAENENGGRRIQPGEGEVLFIDDEEEIMARTTVDFSIEYEITSARVGGRPGPIGRDGAVTVIVEFHVTGNLPVGFKQGDVRIDGDHGEYNYQLLSDDLPDRTIREKYQLFPGQRKEIYPWEGPLGARETVPDVVMPIECDSGTGELDIYFNERGERVTQLHVEVQMSGEEVQGICTNGEITEWNVVN